MDRNNHGTAAPLYAANEFNEQDGPYVCACGNRERFVGVDADGLPGKDADGDCSECGEDYSSCDCTTTLTQDFDVDEDGERDYSRFDGGGWDAEIGSYTSVLCRDCGQLLWQEAPPVATSTDA